MSHRKMLPDPVVGKTLFVNYCGDTSTEDNIVVMSSFSCNCLEKDKNIRDFKFHQYEYNECRKKPIENTNEKQNRRQVFFTTYAVKLTDKSKAFFPS